MDSGNEVIIVDDSIAATTTNGINGHSEEMKTRSRSTKHVAGGQDKAGSDSEKRDKRSTSSSSGSGSVRNVEDKTSKKEVDYIKTLGKETPNVKLTPVDAKVGSASTVKKATKVVEEEKPPVAPLSSKKKTGEREDDSGINSRASSVSNDDTAPRMRTRSSRTMSEMASTSTPARKGHGRVPLSTYDFEDITFDEDLMSPTSLKRKAVVYVEEMDDEEDEEGAGEPQIKRPALALPTYFLDAVFYPFKALRVKLSSISRSAVKAGEEPAAVEEPLKIVVEDAPKENISQTEASNEVSESSNAAANTCIIM